MKEVEMANDKIILFIDELHVMVGAGGSDGAIDASNILKPSLARGKLRCLGATTSDEYAKHVEKDPALARRFQSVYVSEPTAEHTVQILKGLRDKYETHHQVLISDQAIKAAVHLSGRYLPAKRYPDKAIDLIDEAASRIRNRRERRPPLLLRLGQQLEDAVAGLTAATATPTAVFASGGSDGSAYSQVEERNWNHHLSGSGTKELVCDPSYTVEQVTELAAQHSKLLAQWESKNRTVDAIFEARTELSKAVDSLHTQRANNIEDADGFLTKRVQQKETELSAFYALLENSPTTFEGDPRCAVLAAGAPGATTALPVNNGSNNNGSTSTSRSSANSNSSSSSSSSNNSVSALQSAMRSIANEVNEEELAAVVSQSTGIPITTMLGDSEKVRTV
jgi:ATP-dependent Clp protease ATP-binding subunit ClpA